MCRIKKKNQNDQSKQESSRRDDKSDESSSSKISLMIKRLINELSESELAESETTSFVNSVNNHIIKKILNSDAIDHIFCNRSSFITYIFKIFICEIDTKKKFISERYESVVMCNNV
jgi:hypothetical protein